MIINSFGDGGAAGLNITTLSAGATIWQDGVLNSALTIVDDSYGGHGPRYDSASDLPSGYDGTNFFGFSRNGYRFYNELINFAPLIGKTITADIYSGVYSCSSAVALGLKVILGYQVDDDAAFTSTTVTIPAKSVIGGKVGTVTLTIPSYATFGLIVPFYSSSSSAAVWYGGNNMKISS